MRQGGPHCAPVERNIVRPIPHRKPLNHVFSSLRPKTSEVWKHVRQVRQIAPTASTPRAYTLPNTPQTSINP